jgi:hypothetical protein
MLRVPVKCRVDSPHPVTPVRVIAHGPDKSVLVIVPMLALLSFTREATITRQSIARITSRAGAMRRRRGFMIFSERERLGFMVVLLLSLV